MIFSYLFFLASVFFFVLFVYFFILFRKTLNKYIFYYSIGFLFLFLFTFSFSVPVVVWPDNPEIASWGYIFGIFFIFCVLLSCLWIQTIVANNFLKKHFIFFNIIIILIGISALFLELNNPPRPQIGDIAVIWNADIYASAIVLFTGFSYGMFWSYLFYRVAILIKERELKTKMYTLSINGLLQGSSALFLFTYETVTRQLIGISLLGMSGFMSIFLFTFPTIYQKIKKHSKDMKQL